MCDNDDKLLHGTCSSVITLSHSVYLSLSLSLFLSVSLTLSLPHGKPTQTGTISITTVRKTVVTKYVSRSSLFYVTFHVAVMFLTKTPI